MTFDDHELADIFRDRSHPCWPLAFEAMIHRVFMPLLRLSADWPRVRATGSAGSDHRDVAEEMANEFWVFLTTHPRVLLAEHIDGIGAVITQARRFLRDKPSFSVEAAEPNLKEHFRRKLLRVLRDGGFRQTQYREWRTHSARNVRADQSDITRALREQPTLAAIWSPQNATQDPPIARDDDLLHHATIVLEILDANCPQLELRNICWTALSPSFEEAISSGLRSVSGVGPVVTERIHDDVTADDPAVETVGAPDEFRDYLLLPKLLSFVEKLDHRRQRIMTLSYVDGLSDRAIATRLSMPKTTVGTLRNETTDQLQALFMRHGYTREEMDAELWRSLIKVVRTVLASCDLPGEEERK